MEKEILKLLAILTEDSYYRQVYHQQIKLLFDMLEREQKTYCRDDIKIGTNSDYYYNKMKGITNSKIGGNHTAGNFDKQFLKPYEGCQP